MAQHPGTQRAAETLLRMSGRSVKLRVLQPPGAPPMELTLRPCRLTVTADANSAELLVAATALAEIAGLPEELFSVTARIVADEIVWRVVSYNAISCGETVICWRVQLAR